MEGTQIVWCPSIPYPANRTPAYRHNIAVRVGGQLSEPFETTSGVRQGCVLAPALFCIAIDWILSSCIQVPWAPQSAPRNSRTRIMLMMPCYFLTALLSGRTSCQASMKLHIGLNTSWSKTKIQNLSHGVTPAPVQLQGHVVESTDRFTYLGSDIHSSERSTQRYSGVLV